jgi:hypothetical protein
MNKKSQDGFRYASTRNIKDNIEVQAGFTKIPNKGSMPLYDWTNDEGTEIYVPFNKFFKMRCNLDSNTWDPYALNGSNVHKHPRHALQHPQEEEGTILTLPQKRAEIKKGATGLSKLMKKASTPKLTLLRKKRMMVILQTRSIYANTIASILVFGCRMQVTWRSGGKGNCAVSWAI